MFKLKKILIFLVISNAVLTNCPFNESIDKLKKSGFQITKKKLLIGASAIAAGWFLYDTIKQKYSESSAVESPKTDSLSFRSSITNSSSSVNSSVVSQLIDEDDADDEDSETDETDTKEINEENTKKSNGSNDFHYGVAQRRGGRPEMQDEYCCLIENKDISYSMFGVFDGHSKFGLEVAQYVKKNICKNIIMHKEFNENIQKAIFDGFISTNIALKSKNDFYFGGTTAVMAIFKNRKIYVANVGDSRAVLSSNGNAIPLSIDHKATRPDEIERIKKAGSFVLHNRVEGCLAISRAFGDFQYTAVIVEPEIKDWDIIPDDDFLILASDGVWDCFSNQEAVDIVNKSLHEKPDDYIAAANSLRDAAFNFNPYNSDNITVLVIDPKTHFYN